MKTNKLIIAALAVTTAFTACKKGTISSKRLDGTWKLTSGTGTVKEEETDNNTTVTTTSNLTWDGTNVTVTQQTLAGTINYKSGYTSEFTFDKKEDTFKSVTKSDNFYENTVNYGYYLTLNDCENNQSVNNLTVKNTYTSVTTATGLFTVLGATGEIEKNSRFLTETTSNSTTSSSVITYMQGSSVMNNVYTRSTVSPYGCVLAPTAMPTTTTTNNDVDDSGTIVTISESTKSEMTVTAKTVNTDYGVGSDKDVSTMESSMKYTKQD